MGFTFKDAKHQEDYNKASSEVRKLRQQIIDNLSMDNQPINADLDADLSARLNKAKAKKLKLQPSHPKTRDTLLHAYA